jgi:hypothetical protein
MVYFDMLFIRLFLSYDLGNKFDEFTVVDPGCFLYLFFVFFSISSFNISLIEN